MAKLFVTLSREEAETAAPVESTPMKGSEASDVIENAQDVVEETQQVEEMMASIEEAEDALDDLQEAENMAAASAGEEPVDVITGEPVAGAENAECDSETPGVTEPTPTGTEEAVAAPAPEVAAAVATECLRQVKKRLGMESEGIQVSFESLDSRGAATSLQLAREGIGEAASKIWEAIKAMFKKIWDKIKELWGKFTGLFKKKVEVVEQIAEEIKEAEGSDGIKLSASDFTNDEKIAIAKKCAICIGKNSDAMENLELAAKKIAATGNAIKAAAAAVANIPQKAGKKDINEIVTETLEKIKSSFSVDMSISGGSSNNKFNSSDIQLVTNVFTGKVMYATKLDKGAIKNIVDKLGKAKEVTSHNVDTVEVDGFADSAALNRLSGTISPLDSKQFLRLADIVRKAALKDYPDSTVANKGFSTEGEKAIADLEKMFNKKREKGDEKVKFDSGTKDGLDTGTSDVKYDIKKDSAKLGGFINKLTAGLTSSGANEVSRLFEAIELWGKTTITAGTRKKTPKEK